MNEILIMGHKNPDTDSICSALVHEILDKKNGVENTKATRLGNINKETQYVIDFLGVQAPELIEKVEEGQEIILVDHNEASQSVDNRENAKVIKVVDHHRISDFSTNEPLYYNAKPYGCTSTILFEEFKTLGIQIERTEAVLMLSAIISDTLLLKSPTTTQHDINAFNELSSLVDFDVNEYGLDMLKAGTDISTFTAEEVINLDAKEFNEKGKKFIVSQVNTADINDVFSRKEEISFAMEKEISDKNLDLFMFVITDIINSDSKVIVLGNEKGVVEKAFGKVIDEDDSIFLEGVVSRKKQIAPPLLENL